MKRPVTSRSLSCAILIFSALGCASAPGHHPLTMATMYAQSAEFAAASRSVYAAARVQLDDALADPDWSAALEQGVDFAGKPPAIVLDVDETVLDNSPYEARLIEDGASYPSGWDSWCNEGVADSVPGALALTKYAAERGVTVFYLTNRKAHLEEGTYRNLVARGFPVDGGLDALLMADERPDWTSNKSSRRQHLSATHRIVMMFGDNLGDFVARDEARGTPAEREGVMASHGEWWGTRWFMVPNAMYGYWDGAVLDYDYERGEDELDRLRLDALEQKR